MKKLTNRLRMLGTATALTLLLAPLGSLVHAAPAADVPLEKTIQEVQGNGASSPLLTADGKGPLVSIKGVVTSVNVTDQHRKGFFIQTPGTAEEIPVGGSHGIFISLVKKTLHHAPQVGQCVTVVGNVDEMGNSKSNRLTRLENIKSVTVSAEACAPVKAVALTEIPTDEQLELLEGMLVRPQGEFQITSTKDFHKKGVLELANKVNPGHKVLLDDGVHTHLKNSPLPFIPENVTVSVGDTLSFHSDVLVDVNGALRLQPLLPVAGTTNSPVSITKAGENPPAPKPDETPDPGGNPNPGGGTNPTPPPASGNEQPISAVQGTGFKSPLENQPVTVKGVVTARYPHGNINGFYIQTPGSGKTAPTNGSEAIFIYTGKNNTTALPEIGNCVKVAGTVKEHAAAKNPTEEQFTTQITDPTITALNDCDPVTTLELAKLPQTAAESEAIEGMLIKPQQKLVVTDNYELNTFGVVGLSKSGKLLPQATDVARPGQAAEAVEAQNKADFIKLDDGVSWNYMSRQKASDPKPNPNPRDFALPYVTKENPVRLGAAVTFTDGVIYEYRYGWVLQARQPVHGLENSSVQIENNRPQAAPQVQGDVKIATYNVLNYFVHLGKDHKCRFYADRDGNPVVSNGCSVRGAYSEAAFQDQQAKIVTAINKLNADVVGLEEVENSSKFGKDRDFALAHLVSKLNEAGGTWDYVRSPQTVPNNGDFIRTAFIFNKTKVKPVGDSEILADPSYNNLARSPLAQKFTPVVGEKQTGTDFVVVVNHFKSKRPPRGGSNPEQQDQQDGQGGWNPKRVEQAEALANWVNATYANTPVFLIGDFNSYSQEDPIVAFANLGFTKVPTQGHSYLFGGRVGSLDHAITNPAGQAIVNGKAQVWEINAHEPVALEYSRKNYTASDLYTTDEFRSSDHNPEIFGINVIKEKDTNPKPPEGDKPVPPPAVNLKPISEIQGTGMKSPLVGQTVTTKGVVTAAYPTGNLNGFYIQTPGSGSSVPANGSEAIFVYAGAKNLNAIPKLGSCVQVKGTVAEYGAKNAKEDYEFSTQLTNPTVTPAQDCAPVTALELAAVPATDAEKEAIEGMLVKPTGALTVTDNYTLGQYGTLTLAFGAVPLQQPTDVAAPGSDAAKKIAAQNKAAAIVLDDGSTWNYLRAPGKNAPLDPRNSALPYLTLDNPVRVGAPVTFNDSVVFEYRFGWVLQPRQQVVGLENSPISVTNNRPVKPEVVGDVKVATFNVLNYFTDLGENEPGCKAYTDREGNKIGTNRCKVRGAYSAAAFQMQKDKIVSAISALDADIVSLEEIENSAKFGKDRDEALLDLVAGLNQKAGSEVWAAVPSPAAVPNNGDAIRTAFIYKRAVVKVEGESLILDDSAFTGVARSPLAQKFSPVVTEKQVGKPFVLIVNHFKSKGSVASGHGQQEGDFDGQGNNNPLRVEQAIALAKFANDNFADVPTFLLGDFNAYSKEDPIMTLASAGYAKLPTEGHSYVYKGLSGSLDHVLANEAGTKLLTASNVKVWEINAHEPLMLEYSRHNYNVTNLYAADQWRSSDHNPEIFGLKVVTEKPTDPDTPTPQPPAFDLTGATLEVEKPEYPVSETLVATFTLPKPTTEKEVDFYIQSDPTFMGRAKLVANPNGEGMVATISWQIPANFPLGKHQVIVRSLAGKDLLSQPVNIVKAGEQKPSPGTDQTPGKDKTPQQPKAPAKPGKQLPKTGLTAGVAFAGITALFAGVTLVAWRRRA
ncbi:ExeM/NucH family extracellular endonuclease [Gleimia sp. 6138-11-ORH1]|uniref:ExeM/NucH family extracellular endonuclease n=1 Tax=Gleimia sp. 6138-11-ORH1 TaxID=2973937 RepID=UPI002168AE2A|nr:ExeM/NucH family extracellular endonuclease [Gleimia sp. 6138-11-ORH1]MCS4484397.1 ExeM/NucH family extracellular endonuclease [Gleimia sp. 6138-11-ORH1]